MSDILTGASGGTFMQLTEWLRKDWIGQQALLSSATIAGAKESSGGLSSRMRLLAQARRDLESLNDISGVARQNTDLILSALVADGTPTPQVGLDGEGGVETEWLVNGKALILNCDARGQSLLWGLHADGTLIFRRECNARMIDSVTKAIADTLLQELGRGVANRISMGSPHEVSAWPDHTSSRALHAADGP